MTKRTIKIVATDGECIGGNCPTIYQTESGSLVIQGRVLKSALRDQLSIPAGEDAVEIPLLLIRALSIKT